MTMHLQRDLDKLRKSILTLSGLVEESTRKSIDFLRNHDDSLANEIERLEVRINDMEVDIEEDSLKILALHQPVAADLRFIIVVLKVNNDLERMGDQAVNIVNRVNTLSDNKELKNLLKLEMMSEKVLAMVRGSLDALVEADTTLAEDVVAMDDVVDDLHAENYEILRDYASTHPDSISEAMSIATISSNLERIGDLSTNIAEEVLFMIDGEVVRHQHD